MSAIIKRKIFNFFYGEKAVIPIPVTKTIAAKKAFRSHTELGVTK
jgi:hypothetical protein